MKWKTNIQTRLQLISALILLVGLGSAIIIYLAADNDSNSVADYEVASGDLYPNIPSKKYERDLELYGGKANVLANDFRIWFVDLWRGESLAVMIAFITILASSGVSFVANNLSVDEGSDNKPRGKYFNP